MSAHAVWLNRSHLFGRALADYMPSTSQTEGVLRGLAALKPETLAVMHGSSDIGQSNKLLTGLAGVIKESFDKARTPHAGRLVDPG